VIIDLDGLFIFVDPSYAGSFHDVNCLRQSHLHRNWRNYFTHENGGQGTNPYFEYILGDPGYIGTDMYILRWVDRREGDIEGRGNPVIGAFNKHHAGVRIKVEWGDGGLKNRFRKFFVGLGIENDRPISWRYWRGTASFSSYFAFFNHQINHFYGNFVIFSF
jgi:hypothetical protein